MKLLDTDDPALWYALHRLLSNYWADVDVNDGVQVHECYLPGGVFEVLVAGSREKHKYVASTLTVPATKPSTALARVT